MERDATRHARLLKLSLLAQMPINIMRKHARETCFEEGYSVASSTRQTAGHTRYARSKYSSVRTNRRHKAESALRSIASTATGVNLGESGSSRQAKWQYIETSAVPQQAKGLAPVSRTVSGRPWPDH